MWLFVIIIILTSITGFVIKLSLFEHWRNSVWVTLSVILATLALSPLGMRLNTQDVEKFINNIYTLTNLCTLMTAESLVLLLLIAHLLSYHLHRTESKLLTIVFFLPSPVLFFSLFMPLVYCYNNINGYNYGIISMVYLLLAAVILSSLNFLIRFGIHSWQSRLDIVLIMSFIQLIVSMFMPIAVNGIIFDTISEQAYSIKLLISICCLAIFFMLAKYSRKKLTHYFGEPQI